METPLTEHSSSLEQKQARASVGFKETVEDGTIHCQTNGNELFIVSIGEKVDWSLGELKGLRAAEEKTLRSMKVR